MIFRAFFDESRTSPHENKSLVMGGFVGHIDEWKQASETWTNAYKNHRRSTASAAMKQPC